MLKSFRRFGTNTPHSTRPKRSHAGSHKGLSANQTSGQLPLLSLSLLLLSLLSSSLLSLSLLSLSLSLLLLLSFCCHCCHHCCSARGPKKARGIPHSECSLDRCETNEKTAAGEFLMFSFRFPVSSSCFLLICGIFHSYNIADRLQGRGRSG